MQCSIITECTRILANALGIELICEPKTFIPELTPSSQELEASISFLLLWYHPDSKSLICKVKLLNNQ